MVILTGPIEVVLPTYNGAAYLEPQLASIYGQTLKPSRVLLRDDGSSDGTQELIQNLCTRYGSWLQVLPADGNLGCIANVNRLLEATTEPYVALADQDDLWLPDKLERSLGMMQQLESRLGNKVPLLVHSDLEIMDDQAKPLGSRYLQRQRLDPWRLDPADLALTNVVTGCTTLLNRALLQKALPIPAKALMHDWWLALVASVFGRVELLAEPTVLYRQHPANQLGAPGLGWHYWRGRLVSLLAEPAAGGTLRAAIAQAQAFQDRYGIPVSPLPALLRMRRWRRLWALMGLSLQQRPRKHGPLRTLAMAGLLLALPR